MCKMHTCFEISYYNAADEVLPDKLGFKYRPTPFAASNIINCSICDYELITNEAERKVCCLKFSKENIFFKYEPGSTIGILPNNNEELVNKILIRLGLEHVADQCYKLCIDHRSTKKKTSLPKHIPAFGTLRQIFLHNLDLKSIPKKIFLKSLLHYTEDEKEHEALSLLCSPNGSKQYQTLISTYSNLLTLLDTFPSCQPPVGILLEYLPPLLPRPYSISSSPLNKEYLSITFNVEIFTDNQKGLCTAWLEKCIENFEKDKRCEVPIYMRVSSNFLLPKEDSVPIIMIATGTGISPFRSFLEHRHLHICQGAVYGKSWLFYGCRDSNNNNLFKKELKDYLASGALSRLSVAYSRESETKHYVQHEMEKYEVELSGWIVHDGGVVYVCGDVHRVLPAVRQAIVKILKYQGFEEGDAELYLQKMENERRYIVDNWN